MAPSSATATIQQPQPDFDALKTRQHGAWSSGDYAVVGATLQIVGEELCEALDLRAGPARARCRCRQRQCHLAAARRWCEVVSTDYVGALSSVDARERQPRSIGGIQGSRRRSAAVRRASFDAVVSTFGVMFTPNQDRAAADSSASASAAARSGSPLDAGRIHRPAFQDTRQACFAACGREIAGVVGHRGPPRGNVRSLGQQHPCRAPGFHLPLSIGRALR